MVNGLSRALPSGRSIKTAITIVTGSTNIFMATPAQAWEHRIKPGGQALSQNSSSNKASTGRLQRLTHSQICDFRLGRKFEKSRRAKGLVQAFAADGGALIMFFNEKACLLESK
jgi:hypothetical protein